VSAAAALQYVWAATPQKRLQVDRQTGTPARTDESLAFYRKRTEALLRRYMQASLDIGRSPSILGNCMFRGKASSSRVRSFEDRVIFVFDIEKCLKRLEPFSRELVGRIALQEYTQGETAELTGQSVRSIVRKYAEAIDTLTSLFLEFELMPDRP
jgi:hypothetical protein